MDDAGDTQAMEQLEKQLLSDRKTLRAECEEKKEKARTPTCPPADGRVAVPGGDGLIADGGSSKLRAA